MYVLGESMNWLFSGLRGVSMVLRYIVTGFYIMWSDSVLSYCLFTYYFVVWPRLADFHVIWCSAGACCYVFTACFMI